MDNKELVKQWARDDYNVGLTLGESDYIAFCDYCADKGIECSWELFNEYLDEVERCVNEEPLPYEVDPNDFIEEDIEVKVEADEPEELASFAKCVLGSNCEFFDQDFDQPVVDVEMPKAKFDVEPMKYEDEDETSEISDKKEDELEEAQCKYYKSITHPDDDMKQLKEEDEEMYTYGVGYDDGTEVGTVVAKNEDDAYDILIKHGIPMSIGNYADRISLCLYELDPDEDGYGITDLTNPEEAGEDDYDPYDFREDLQVGLDDFLIQDQADEKVPADWEYQQNWNDDMSDEEFVEEFGKAIAAKRLKESKLTEAGVLNGIKNTTNKVANWNKSGGHFLGHGNMNNKFNWSVVKFNSENKQVRTEDVDDYSKALNIAQNWSSNPMNGKAVIVIKDVKDTKFNAQLNKSDSEFKDKFKQYPVTAYVNGKVTANKISDIQKVVNSIEQEVGKVKPETNNGGGQGETDNSKPKETTTGPQTNNNKPKDNKPEDNKPQNQQEDDRTNYTLVGDDGIRGGKLKGKLAASKDLNKLKSLKAKINANNNAKIFTPDFEEVNESLKEGLDSNVEAATEKLMASLKADGFKIDEKESGGDRVYVRLTVLDDDEIKDIFEDDIDNADDYIYLNAENLSDYEKENLIDDFWYYGSLDVEELENEYNVKVSLDPDDIGSDDVYYQAGEYHDATRYDSGYKDDDEIEGPMEVWGYIYITDK